MRARTAEQAAHDDAVRVVDRWNGALATGRAALWSPTIRCAVLAGTPRLDVYCPGCGTSRAIDIRTLDRHPLGGQSRIGLALFVVPRRDAYGNCETAATTSRRSARALLRSGGVTRAPLWRSKCVIVMWPAATDKEA